MTNLPTIDSMITLNYDSLYEYLCLVDKNIRETNDRVEEFNQTSLKIIQNLNDHDEVIKWTLEWRRRYGHIQFEDYDAKFNTIFKEIDTLKEIACTHDKMFDTHMTVINHHKVYIKDYIDNENKILQTEIETKHKQLDKKIVSVDYDLKNYNEIQDRRIDSANYKVIELTEIQKSARDKVEKVITRMKELEKSFNNLNMEMYLKKSELAEYKDEVKAILDEVKKENQHRFVMKEVVTKMIDKVHNEVEVVRKDIMDHKQAQIMLPVDIKRLDARVNDLVKDKAEHKDLEANNKHIQILKNEMSKLSGLDQEIQKNDIIRQELEETKVYIAKLTDKLGDKMDKKEKEPILKTIREVGSKMSQNYIKFDDFKKEALKDLVKIPSQTQAIENLKSSKCSFDEFNRFREGINEFKEFIDSEIGSIRQYFNSKLQLKGDKDWVKKIISKMREAFKEFESKERERDEAILSKKTIVDASCGSCDKKMKELKQDKTKYLDWNKLDRVESAAKEVSRSISNFGKGYSRYINLEKRVKTNQSQNFEEIMEKNVREMKDIMIKERTKSHYSIKNKIEIKRKKSSSSQVLDTREFPVPTNADQNYQYINNEVEELEECE